MSETEINRMKYMVCCPLCDNSPCCRGTDKCDAEIWAKKKKLEEIERHTDRQIYDGCILLMQKMVDYFQEYLEYLGYDLDKLDEDERFAVGMSNMEIVRQLFLCHTRNSGGCSTRDFCEKLGVDPYKSVKFEFEESEE